MASIFCEANEALAPSRGQKEFQNTTLRKKRKNRNGVASTFAIDVQSLKGIRKRWAPIIQSVFVDSSEAGTQQSNSRKVLKSFYQSNSRKGLTKFLFPRIVFGPLERDISAN